MHYHQSVTGRRGYALSSVSDREEGICITEYKILQHQNAHTHTQNGSTSHLLRQVESGLWRHTLITTTLDGGCIYVSTFRMGRDMFMSIKLTADV